MASWQNRTIRFAGQVRQSTLEKVYRDNYRGHEHDMRFQPEAENSLGLMVEVKVPHVVSLDDEVAAHFEAAAARALRQMADDLARIWSEHTRRQEGQADG